MPWVKRNRSASDRLVLAVLLALGTGFVASATGPDPDPNELLETARGQLTAGDLDGAGKSLADLRGLLSVTPEWDPDGMFSDTLLPEMEGRLMRLRTTLAALDQLVAERQRTVRPPRAASEEDILPKFTDWARTTIRDIRAEAEARVAAGLPDPADRAILVRTGAYAAAQRRLEAVVLRRMAESLGRELDRILAEDERSDALKTRLDVVKRSTVDLAVERGRLRDELQECRDRIESERSECSDRLEMQREEGRERLVECRQELDRYIQVLSDMLMEGEEASPEPAESESDPVGNVFASVLDHDLERLRSQTAHSPLERSRWRRSLSRYRHYNRVLASARVASDQGARIRTLEAAVNDIPVETVEPPVARGSAGRIWIPLAMLTLATALLGWWLGRRGRPAGAAIRHDREDR
jgi:hypothetical protein